MIRYWVINKHHDRGILAYPSTSNKNNKKAINVKDAIFFARANITPMVQTLDVTEEDISLASA